MKTKEPEFMQELHSIRAKLSRKWEKMSNAELIAHLQRVGKDFEQSFRLRKSALSHSR